MPLFGLHYLIFFFCLMQDLYLHANFMISYCLICSAVCLLANDGRNFFWLCGWILSHVHIPQEKENLMSIGENGYTIPSSTSNILDLRCYFN